MNDGQALITPGKSLWPKILTFIGKSDGAIEVACDSISDIEERIQNPGKSK